MLYRPINDIHREWDRLFFYQTARRHPELWDIYTPSPLDTDKDTVLGIAGDIDVKKYTVKFLKEMSGRFKAVVAVLGNHDLWRRDFTSQADKIKAELAADGITNVHLLDRDSVVIDGVRFIGATLWTDFNKGDTLALNAAEEQMNDYKLMRKMNYERRVKPHDLLAAHIKDRDFIFSFANNDERMVVLSHHAPSFKSVDYSRYGNGLINTLYATELGNEIAYSKFAIWHHGHIHTSRDYLIYETRVLCNPRGYFNYNMNSEFNDQILIEV